MYQAKSGVKHFFLYWGGGGPSGTPRDGVPPCPRLDRDTPLPPSKAGSGPPPSKAGSGPTLHPRLDRVPSPPIEVWTDKLKTVPSSILRMRAVNMHGKAITVSENESNLYYSA